MTRRPKKTPSAETGMSLIEALLGIIVILAGLGGGLAWIAQVNESTRFQQTVRETDALLQASEKFVITRWPELASSRPVANGPNNLDFNADVPGWIRQIIYGTTTVHIMFPSMDNIAEFLADNSIFPRVACQDLDPNPPVGAQCRGNCFQSPQGGVYRVAIAFNGNLADALQTRNIAVMVFLSRLPRDGAATAELIQTGRRVVAGIARSEQILARQLTGETVTSPIAHRRVINLAREVTKKATNFSYRQLVGPCARREMGNIRSIVFAAAMTVVDRKPVAWTPPPIPDS